MDIGADQLHDLRADLARARLESLSRTSRPGEGSGAGGDVDVPAPTDDRNSLEHRELLGYLRDAVQLLPERHRVVIVGYFLEGRSMTELGDFLGVTQSRASQLKTQALGMMREGLASVMDDAGGAEGSPPRKQDDYNRALRSASTWRQRLGAAY